MPDLDRVSDRPVAPLVEVFHSIQGEGRFVGTPMAFVRVAVCPLRCNYCDTPHSYEAEREFPVHLRRGPRYEPNPVDVERATALVREVLAGGAFATGGGGGRVSVTGGEPLLYPVFVRELGLRLRGHGVALHLESAAVQPAALCVALPGVSHLSADYKLPETVTAGEFGARHARCVADALAAGISVDVKVVLTAAVQDASFAGALADLAPFRAQILLVLQPVTPFGAVQEPFPVSRLEECTARALAAGFTVRVLPQAHKLLRVQ
ncbi:MAG: 7-carboxy-7-deazaguanine synthase QueE [Planctomycetes bacterium]|nr:7-carboxy-7-deazaguanine synthase QueE [Planctomycetota bacterium]